MSRVCVLTCRCCVFVSAASGDHMVETYLSLGFVMALYIVSFCFHHVVDVSALSICIVLRAFVVVISMCLLYVSLGSRVSLSIFGWGKQKETLMATYKAVMRPALDYASSIWSPSCILDQH